MNNFLQLNTVVVNRLTVATTLRLNAQVQILVVSDNLLETALDEILFLKKNSKLMEASRNVQ